MIPEPYTPTEDDLAEFLIWSAQEHESGTRRTDDLWPEEVWEIADKVAAQGEVRPKDLQEATTLYRAWLLNDEE